MQDVQITRVALKTPPAEIAFKGLFKVRLLLGEDDRKRVVVTELADALGVLRHGLRARAERNFARGCSMMKLPPGGETHHVSPPGGGRGRGVRDAPPSVTEQDFLTLDLRYLPALLLGIEVPRVRAELRPRLEEIQEELTDVLAAYTFDGIAINPAFPAPPAAPALTEARVRAIVREELELRGARPGEQPDTTSLRGRLEWILEHRAGRKRSQRAFSLDAGLGPTFFATLLNRLKHGEKASLGVVPAAALAKAAGVELEWLATGEGPRDLTERPSELTRGDVGVEPFLRDVCQVGGTYRVAKGELYEAYTAWMGRHGERPLGPRAFGDEVRRAGISEVPTACVPFSEAFCAKHPAKAGKRDRGWEGIRVKTLLELN